MNDSYTNVIVDGLNLAFRNAYAPGLAELRDSKGRQTGMIYGFLRSLNALLRKFNSARVWVCWDGSNHRRKQRFADYKGNRTPMTVGTQIWNPVQYLRSLLELTSVVQAFNPEEECDDVIASLVRGPLKGQRNLILSTDQDFLQLVTKTDTWLRPGLQKRPETFYTPERVEAEWKVPVEKIVLLRALLGDASDNIPGVPRVSESVLVQLVLMYGSLDAIFASPLPELRRSVYSSVRGSERQVRLNEELMTLNMVPFTEISGTPNPAELETRLEDVSIASELLNAILPVKE